MDGLGNGGWIERRGAGGWLDGWIGLMTVMRTQGASASILWIGMDT